MKESAFEAKSVVVLGVGLTGRAVAKLMKEMGKQVLVNDQSQTLPEEIQKEFDHLGIPTVLGGHPLSILDQSVDVVIKNPGIPYKNPLVKEAIKRGIPVITDAELAGLLSEAPIIGITGSNGKTTTTKMTHEVLRHAFGKRVKLGGNIGVPIADHLKELAPEDYFLLELSSFQLQGTNQMRPHIAAITNIYGAHYDYHGSRAAYLAAKMKITANQGPDDYLIYNAHDPELIDLVHQHSKANLVPFNAYQFLEKGASVKDGTMYYDGEAVMATSDLVLPGIQNVENALIAMAIGKILQVPNETISQSLKSFYGVKHRLQRIDDFNGAQVYNDSKATNIAATTIALKSFQQPIRWIAGGLDRGNGFEDLAPYVGHVVSAVVYGQTKAKLADFCRQMAIPVTVVENLKEAVETITPSVKAGEILLFSPSCASWDQFKTFEERGDCFIHYMEQMKGELPCQGH